MGNLFMCGSDVRKMVLATTLTTDAGIYDTDKECVVFVTGINTSQDSAIADCSLDVTSGDMTSEGDTNAVVSSYKNSSGKKGYVASIMYLCKPTPGSRMQISLGSSALYAKVFEKQ